MEYKQTILGKCPSKSNSYKIITLGGHPSIAKMPALKLYEKSFYMQCRLRDLNITDFFKFDMDVYYENMRPDIDNSYKVVLDCLQSCNVIKNDRQCVELHARKLIDKMNPRIEMTITPVIFKE